MVSVTVWNEYRSERTKQEAESVYPDGIHTVIASALEGYEHDVRTATLDEPEHGLTEDVLAETDVLTWWGHEAHGEVDDEIVDRVTERVLDGMGLIVLHSGHYAKVFTELMGTSCSLKWRGVGERERIWTIEPGHPIADGLESERIELENAEMFGERFDVPPPDDLVFVSWFEGGEVFRSGCCYNRGKGKVFYFRPGHETYPIYENAEIQQVLHNAVEWAAPSNGPDPEFESQYENPLENVEGYTY